MPLDPKIVKQFEEWGATPPTSEDHGTIEEIRSNLRPANPTNWRQEGNKLIADTDFGPLVNHIPTDHILTGVDDKGLPVFRIIE